MAWVFDAELWLHHGEASWHFVTLPEEVADEIAEARDGPGGPGKAGFGSVRVVVTVGGTTWPTSVFPDGKLGSYVLPVKKSVRDAEGLSDGSSARVALELALDGDGGAP